MSNIETSITFLKEQVGDHAPKTTPMPFYYCI